MFLTNFIFNKFDKFSVNIIKIKLIFIFNQNEIIK